MSPDRKSFADLRRIVAEREALQQQARLEQEAFVSQARLRAEAERVAMAAKFQKRNEALVFLQESDLESIVKELASLYENAGKGQMLYRVNDYPYDSHSNSGGIAYYLPFEAPIDHSFISVRWGGVRESRIGVGRFSKTFREPIHEGILMLTDYLGNLSVLGAETQKLPLSGWRGIRDVQEEAVERAFRSPFALVGKEYSAYVNESPR